MRIQVFPQRAEVDPEEQKKVKEFLLKSLKHEAANWPDNIHCTIFIDGKTMRVVRGSDYQIYSKDVYVGHGSTNPPPHWVPGVLSAIAFFFRLEADQDLVQLSIELLAKVLADAIRPYQTLLAQSFNGRELSEIAIDSETRTLLAKLPPLEEGGPDRWMAQNGEEMILGPNHFVFPVPNFRG